MKTQAILLSAFLAAAALVLFFAPSYVVLTTALSACFLVILVVGWSCAVRERSFGVLGFSDLALQKPIKATLSGRERFAVQAAAAVAFGMLVAVAWRLVGPA